jgi:hypothetical protein
MENKRINEKGKEIYYQKSSNSQLSACPSTGRNQDIKPGAGDGPFSLVLLVEALSDEIAGKAVVHVSVVKGQAWNPKPETSYGFALSAVND